HLHQCLVASCFGRGPATYEIYPLSLHDALPLWRRCLAHRTTVVVAAAGALLAAALTAVLPLIVRHVVDETTSGAASVLPWALALLAAGIARFAASSARRIASSQLSLGVQHDLRGDLFAALLRLDGREQASLRTGQV